MLKRRIGAALIVKDEWVVQSIGFSKYLPVGRPEIAVEFLNNWGVDEIILLDISASKTNQVVSSDLVGKAAKFCRVPLAVGGGISSVSQMEELLHHGADKICLNQSLKSDIGLITQGALKFGDQCMVAVIDFMRVNSDFMVYDYKTGSITNQDLTGYARELEKAGAGELLLQSVNRDGKYDGFEIEAYSKVCSEVNIPVIALGGAGHAGHFIDLLDKTEVSAACAGNIFHFMEHSVNTLKAQLLNSGNNIRLETFASYQDKKFDHKGRLNKASDEYLEDLLFIRIEKETI